MSKIPSRRLVIAFALMVCALLLFNFKRDFVSQAEPKPAALLAPSIMATNNDALVVDNDGDGRADPGDTIEYTVTVTNGAAAGAGNDATGTIFTDTLDSNMTLVTGSVQSSPIAGNDSFNVLGNVSISVPDGASDLLANDIDPDTLNNTGLTASGGATSAQGGNVTINANGSFTYNPPPGFEGTDTFTYTVADGNGNTGTGTVTLNISGMIWFVNNDAAACTTLAAGCGRLANPFSTLAAFQSLNNGTGNNPATNDNIFVFESATAYTGGVTLLNGQKFIGQDATATLATISGVTVPTFSAALPAMNTGAPAATIQNAAGNGVTLGTGNVINGFTLGNSGSAALAGTSFGTATVDNIIINSTGQALNLTTGTIAGTGFNSVTSTGGAVGISLVNIGGTVALGAGALSGISGTPFFISGGTAAITYSGGITKNTAGLIVGISAHSTGNITLSGNLTCNAGCTGISVTTNTSGTITFSGATKTLNTGSNPAANLTNNTGATINFSNGGLDIDTATGTGFNATGGGTISVTTGANPNTIDSGTGTALNVANTTIGASGLTFRNISANGAANGIALNNTGTSGGLTVTGIGSTNGSGGTMQNVANRGASFTSAANISLSNMTFTNTPTTDGAGNCGDLEDGQPGNAGCNAAIHLDTVTGATLTNTDISGGTQQGVNGTSVTNFSLTNSNLSNMGDEVDESGVRLRNVFGTSSISNNTIDDGYEGNIYVINTVGTAGTLTVNNNTLNNSTLGVGGRFATSVNGNFTVNATNNTIQNNLNSGLQMAFDGGTGGFTATNNNVLNGGSPGISVGGTAGTATYNISDNTVTNPDFVSFNAGASGNMTLTGRMDNNTTDGPENTAANSIVVTANSTATHTALVEDNDITNYDGTSTAMFILANQGSARGNFTVRNNVVNGNNNPGATNAILVRIGSLATDTNQACVAVYGNDVNNWNASLIQVRVHLRFTTNTTHFRNGQAGTDLAILNANNPLASNNAYDTTAPAISTQTNTPCALPSFSEPLSNNETISSQPTQDMSKDFGFYDLPYQTPSEMLATLEPAIKSSANTRTISTEAAIAEAEVIETPEIKESLKVSSIFSDASNFLSELSAKLGETLSPTVYSQGKEEIPVQISGETITVGAPGGFTLPAAKSVTIKFRATIDNVTGLTQVSNQGTVSGSNFSNVLTDDPTVAGSANPTLTPVDSTTVTVSSSQNPSIVGQTVTFTATLTGAPVHGTGDPGGTVEFFDNGTSIGTATVAAGTLNDNTGTATLVVSNLTAGNHPITATFSGGGTGPGGYNANNTSNTLNQTVGNTAVWDGSASGAWENGANWATNAAPSLATNDVSIPAAGVTNNPIISAANVTVNNLTLSAGRTLTVNTSRTLNINGVLTMNGNNIDATNGVIALSQTATITRTSGSILGNLDKTFGATGAFLYPTGTATGYSPVNVNITALAVNPSTLRVRANDGTAPAAPPLNDAVTLDRYFSLTETGDLTANITFNYLQADVDGNENNYRLVRISGGAARIFPLLPSINIDPAGNTFSVTGLSSFSDWTLAELAPTAAQVAVSGRVVTSAGRGVFNAEVVMTGADGQPRVVRTNHFGYYRFTDVQVGETYTMNVRHKLYEFAPQVHTVTDESGEVIFVASE